MTHSRAPFLNEVEKGGKLRYGCRVQCRVVPRLAPLSSLEGGRFFVPLTARYVRYVALAAWVL